MNLIVLSYPLLLAFYPLGEPVRKSMESSFSGVEVGLLFLGLFGLLYWLVIILFWPIIFVLIVVLLIKLIRKNS